MGEGGVLNLGLYCRWLTQLRCLKMIMNNEVKEAVGHITECSPSFQHGHSLISAMHLQFLVSLPVCSVVVRARLEMCSWTNCMNCRDTCKCHRQQPPTQSQPSANWAETVCQHPGWFSRDQFKQLKILQALFSDLTGLLPYSPSAVLLKWQIRSEYESAIMKPKLLITVFWFPDPGNCF